jgi:NADH:ubiquinone oxidoreductase subunit E
MMTQDDGAVEIVVCLGSSCFARGNSENLAIINTHVQSHGLKASVRMTGQLCKDECMQGPNLSIGGTAYHGVTAARLRELLQQPGRPSRGEHGTT